MEKIKILYIHPNLNVGGTEEVRYTYLTNIDRNKYDVALYCIGQKGQIGHDLEGIGYKVYARRTSLRFFNFLILFYIFGYLKKNKFDIVQTCLPVANLYGRLAAVLAGVKCVIIEEKNYAERYPRRFGFIFKKINKALSKYTYKIIASSLAIKKYLVSEENISEEKIEVIYNPIDPARFSIEERNHLHRLKAMFGLKKGGAVIGYVATLIERKGHVYLFHAFKKVLNAYPQTTLLLAGDGPSKEKFQALTKKMGLDKHVLFMGLRRDVPKILGLLDIYVSATLVEAFGVNLVEAMYMQLPCIATNVGGIPEVVKDGQTGILVPERDSDRLSESIIRLLKDRQLAEKMGTAGKERVERNFLIDKYKSRVEKLYSASLERFCGRVNESKKETVWV